MTAAAAFAVTTAPVTAQPMAKAPLHQALDGLMRLGALANLNQWCAVLILHINNKGCSVTAAPRPGLALKVGRRYDQPADQAFQIDFGYQVLKDSATELSNWVMYMSESLSTFTGTYLVMSSGVITTPQA